MELMQLEMFVAVVEEHSVTRAAERVRRTQPAVSFALGKLERELETVLVKRSRGQFKLTKPGELMYEYASRILGLRDEAVSMLLEESAGLTGRLTIGVSGTRTLQRIARFTSPFRRRYPEVRVELLCDQPVKLLADLVERKIDFALLPAQPEGLERNADLVMSSVSGFGPEKPLWLVERRIGSSHLKKVFEEMLALLARRASGQNHARLSKPDAQLRRLRAENSR
jgi:DNA-binding transcriptional LysR family regulator